MSQVVQGIGQIIVGAGEFIAGGLITIGTLGGGAALGIGLMAGGVGTVMTGVGTVEAGEQSAQEQASTGAAGGTSPGSTQTSSSNVPSVLLGFKTGTAGTGGGTGAAATGATPQEGGGGNAPGAPSAIVPTQREVYQEQAQAANLAQASYENQALSQILGMKVQEQTAESSIMASAAARGLRLTGSPLAQLATQKQRGEQAIGLAESSFKATDTAQSLSNQATWNQQILNLAEANFQIQANQTNQWLSSWASVVNYGTSLIKNFWTPSVTPPSSSGAGYTGYE
jgi:hypothetical protein